MNSVNHQQKNLLALAALLIVANVLLVPIMEWQKNVLVEIRLSQSKLAKTRALIDSQEKVKSRVTDINAYASQLEQKLPYVSALSFKNETQTKITTLLGKSNVKLDRISWVEGVKKDGISKHSIQLSISGRMSDYLTTYFELVALFPNGNFSKTRADINRHAAKNLGQVKGRILIDFHIREKANDNS